MEVLSSQPILISIFILSLYLALHHYNRYLLRKSSSTISQIGFKNYPILGNIPSYLANSHRVLEWSTSALSTTPTNTDTIFYLGRLHHVMTASPLVVEHILKSNFPNYPKGPQYIEILQDFLGQGIFNSDSDLWLLQRKTASYEFNKRSFKNFVLDSVKCEIQTCLIPLLKEYSASGNVIDLQDVLERFAFDNVCKLTFNVHPGSLSGYRLGVESDFMKAFEVATTLSSGRFMYAMPCTWLVKRFLDIGSEKTLRESIKIVHDYADKIINSRLDKNSGYDHKNQDDLLSRFIATQENSPELLRDVVISFILAGRDTTSSGLSWFFWLLSHHPEVTEKIRTEVKHVRVQSKKNVGDTFNYDELRELQYLYAALSESMRLYPPVPIDTKTCLQDDLLPDGTKIKKGWFISYHTYAMGRMEKIWGKDCETFRPERWLDENKMCKVESAFKYPVFHAGPRICLGREMAFIQMKSIVACVVEMFDVDVVMDKETAREMPEYVLALTLRMKNGLKVRVSQKDSVVDH